LSGPAGRAQAGAPGARERDAALARRLEEVLGAPLSEQPRQLSSGASRETFIFATAAHGPLVLQVDRGAKPGSGPPPQAALLGAAADVGVPVARVIAQGGAAANGAEADSADALGPSWTVVEALAGGADPAQILDGRGAPAPEQLLDEVAAALAAVHRIAADEALAPAVDDPIGVLRATHDALGEPHPVFELAFRALGEGPPPAARRTFVHGDFRMGNLMVAEHGLTGVLDWELAHLGDPLEDLGWLCVPAWRFHRPDRPAAGLGSREQLAAAYERHAGVEVDRAALAWWELAGTLRWGVICVMQAFTHLSGAARSVEHAVIGRRACEVEWDLLEMLDERAGQDPGDSPGDASAAGGDAHAHAAGRAGGASAAAATASLHDRPTAVELIEAARGALGDEVLPLLEGRAAFQLRVSLRALGMVGRELSLAPAHAALERELLGRFGAADERGLAAAIREGRLAERDAELRGALRRAVRARLAVANPKYVREEQA
jgi:aminoglycoside phosphotransferase (APT) family kinase protein